MNSRWQASKVGLINFWYYDEQEFSFAGGRMLLRGSNGSGKSVTMQSVIPLLLDGNVSPERLDPFGTRDRKISNYLLEEGDEREERTGYLYLELRRKESAAYLTIGMGLRARRGKPLDKWYFGITDNRRIGESFWLYKTTGEKIPLSKKELENRLGDGGRVLDSQKEYMEYVNRQVFGFDTVEEYKELIDLLIQLRTPKLSKDFKPTVINEILSDSLPALSDDDLRPMSEAIENMDAMNMNLKTREAASQAAEKINRIFARYNQKALYEKADRCEKAAEALKALHEEETEKQRQLQMCKENIATSERELIEMDAKQRSMQKERDTLNKSNAVNLKTRETELGQEIESYQKTIHEKEDFLDGKRMQQMETEQHQKEEETRIWQRKTELEALLEEMQEEAADMAFEEHGFFQAELLEKLEEEYAYDALRRQLEDTRARIGETLHILEQTEIMDRQADDLTKRREDCGRSLDTAQRKEQEWEAMLVQAQNEWKEEVYRWRETNQELVVGDEVWTQMCHFADTYDASSDFAQVQKQIGTCFVENQMYLTQAREETRRQIEEISQELQQVLQELAQWEGQKEPQPDRSEEVLRNRERLQAMGIPYQEFYKTLEFGRDLGENARNRLEEALLRMGILDAVIVDEQYREQVLAPAEGCADRYLFAQTEKPDKSLLDVLELNDEVNDIFSNQRITGILRNISYGEAEGVAVSERGNYQMGVIAGTVTGTHRAQFLGMQAREQARQDKIVQCRTQAETLRQEIAGLEERQKLLQNRMEKLEEEYASLPGEDGMHTAWKSVTEAQEECERIRREELRLEKELVALRDTIRQQKEAAYALAKKLYLESNLPVFRQAAQAAEQYAHHLARLTPVHEMYRQSIQASRSLEEQAANIEADMDQIRYDISNAQRALGRRQEEYTSVQEQLKLTDYAQIRERLDACVRWLQAYPEALRCCVEKKTENQERYSRLQEQLATCRERIEECGAKKTHAQSCYEAELALGYVELPEDMDRTPRAICTYLGTDVQRWDWNEIHQKLQQVYFENRGFLNDYQLTQTELFRELDENRTPGELPARRMDILARYQGVKISFAQLPGHLEKDIEELRALIRAGDRELFEDILANTVSRKIRSRINASVAWVANMNRLMSSMNTSSGLKLSLRWRSRTAENEEQLDTRELVELLKKDYRLMSEEEAARLSGHFRSKVEQARRSTGDSTGMVSFYQVMKETLDYRKWFEFQLYSQKTGERNKELTNSVFGTFSGGEKAMAMYVPLFSAVVAKYQGGRADAPRLISLDEAFAGVDQRNIRDMFRLMTEFSFDFIINSQVLWGDCDTLDALAIYQLQRPGNARFVTVMPYLWNGHSREFLEE